MRNDGHPKKAVRIGVIGCGSVLEQYAAQAARLGGRATIELACGRERQRAAAAAAGIPRFTTAGDEVIQAPDIDLVLVLTSGPSHGELVRALLEAGKHVLVEKPLATSLDEAGALVDLARRSPGHLSCAPFTALSPTLQAMAHRVRRGDIGRAVSARGRYGWAGPWWGEWFYKPGGGALADLGVYNFTSLTALLGPVRRVTAMLQVAIPERTVDGRAVRVDAEDNGHVLLEHAGGALSAVTTGYTLQQYRSPALEIYGTEGTIQMLGDDWDPDGYELWQNAAGCWQVFKETHPDWPWTDGLRDVVEAIENDSRPAASPEHALHVLEVIARARESAQHGRALEVASTFPPLELAAAKPIENAHLVHDRTRSTDAPGH